MMKEIKGNEAEYIAILLKRISTLEKRMKKAADIWRDNNRELKTLRRKIEELESFITELY